MDQLPRGGIRDHYARIVTSTYRYKRLLRNRKPVPLEGPAIVRRGAAKPETPAGIDKNDSEGSETPA